MASKRRQIKNPYIRFGRTAQGPYAQNLGAGAHARAISRAEAECFFIVSAEIGNPHPEEVLVCFNASPDELTCGLSGVPGFEFQVNSSPAFVVESYIDKPTPNCLRFQMSRVSEGDGVSPDDVVTMDYTPGTCHRENTTDPECVLEALTDYPVTNSIYRVVSARIGDVADNVVVVRFESPLAVIGPDWQVAVNFTLAGITNSQIVGGDLHLTIDVNVDPADEVVINHNGNGAVAVNGKRLYQFYLEPVTNATGADIWRQEGGDRWLVEGSGTWLLE